MLFAANIAVVFLGGLEQLMAAVGGIRPAALPRVLTPRMNHAVAVHTSGPSVALPSMPPARNDPFRPPRWPLFLMAAYLAGVAVFGARLLAGVLMTRRALRSTRAIPSELCEHYELIANADVDLKLEELDYVRVPLTTGSTLMRVIFPADWREWPQAKRRAVLAHELAHRHLLGSALKSSSRGRRMRFALMFWAVLCAGALPAQQPSSPMLVRSIPIELVSTDRVPLKSVDMEVIAGALKSKGINLAVERRFDPSAVDKAAEMIREMYGDDGQKVRVEHTVAQMPPHSLEVVFEVIQLCTCN